MLRSDIASTTVGGGIDQGEEAERELERGKVSGVSYGFGRRGRVKAKRVEGGKEESEGPGKNEVGDGTTYQCAGEIDARCAGIGAVQPLRFWEAEETVAGHGGRERREMVRWENRKERKM